MLILAWSTSVPSVIVADVAVVSKDADADDATVSATGLTGKAKAKGMAMARATIGLTSTRVTSIMMAEDP